MTRLDRHDAAIDEPDRALLGAGVGSLDDALERPVRARERTGRRGRVRRPHARYENRRGGCAAAPPAGGTMSRWRETACRRRAQARPRSQPRGARRPLSARSAVRTASPVPSGGSCTTLSAGATIRATLSICGPITTSVAAGDSGRSAASRCAIIGRPAIGCITLGIVDFMRVPLPAARMMAANRDWLIEGSKRIEMRAAPSRGAPHLQHTRLLQNVTRQPSRCSRRRLRGRSRRSDQEGHNLGHHSANGITWTTGRHFDPIAQSGTTTQSVEP